ncbi:MAG: hypothetical protein V1773_14850 [bacterium]
MARKYSTRERVDELINHFWRNGYLTLSRKYGKYLPEPKPIGEYSVDAVGKYKKKYVIGLILSEEDFEDNRIVSKLNYLATRQNTRYDIKVTLYIGVPQDRVYEASLLIEKTNSEAKKNIKIVPLPDSDR